MNHWIATMKSGIDLEALEESALAMAQSTIQNAITTAGISRAELARKMQCNRSIVSRMLSGNHNLTIKTMARALAACNTEVRFQTVPIEWNWMLPSQPCKEPPANAGGAKSASYDAADLAALALAAA